MSHILLERFQPAYETVNARRSVRARTNNPSGAMAAEYERMGRQPAARAAMRIEGIEAQT